MGTLPPPPSAAKMAPAPAPVAAAPKPVAAPVAQAAAPVAAPVAETSAPAKAAVWGDKAVPVPAFNGVDPIVLISELTALFTAKGVDLAALVEAAKSIPKTSYPGHKYGRAAYSLGNILSALQKASYSLSRTRAARTPGVRVSKTEKLKTGIQALAAKFGGMDAIKATLGEDFLKSLKLDL